MTIRLDPKTKKMLDEYCAENSIKMSHALRELIRDSLERHQQKSNLGFVDSVGPDGLMINEKRAIGAAIESTLLIRKLSRLLLKQAYDPSEIDAEVSKIMKAGWEYDSQSS